VRRSGRGGVLACLALLLGACGGFVRTGEARVYAQSFDTESNACVRFPATCVGADGTEAAAQATRQRLAEVGSNIGSLAAGLRDLTQAQRTLIDDAILECVKDADFQLNDKLFGGNPSREQCAQVLERDARGNPVTQAMRLGTQKHELALQCIQQKLQALRPGGFSLHQRYRLNRATEKWEPLSRKQVESLLGAGGKELVGTIEPDLVLHTGNPAEVLDLYDLKFPCPGTNPPRWGNYPEGHPFENLTQRQVYEQAFKVKPARVSPRWNIERLP
jgi:hypothetical protein